MNTMLIDIINPKAAKLLKDLEEMDLISIRNTSNADFSIVLKKLRSSANSTPTLEEITKEVNIVRSKRYVK